MLKSIGWPRQTTMRLAGTLALGALLGSTSYVDSVELGLDGEDVISLEFAPSSGVWSDDQNDASWGGDSFELFS